MGGLELGLALTLGGHLQQEMSPMSCAMSGLEEPKHGQVRTYLLQIEITLGTLISPSK